MYRIATNVCLTAPGRPDSGGRCPPVWASRSPDPHAGAGAAAGGELARAAARRRWSWGAERRDAADRGRGRPRERTAGVRGRAAAPDARRSGRCVILRDVLAWQASEVAELLELSVAVGEQQPAAGPSPDADDSTRTRAAEPTATSVPRSCSADYVQAFENYDVARDRRAAHRGRGLGDAAVHRLVLRAPETHRPADRHPLPGRGARRSA